MSRVPIFAGWWVALYGLWLLLVFKVEVAELITGAVCAAIATAAIALVKREEHVHFRIRGSWLLPLLRLPWRSLADSAIVFAALARRLAGGPVPRGSFRAIRFEAGGERDPHASSRRALAGWLGSFAPNGFVVGIDLTEDVMLVHELIRSDGPPPGAELARPR
jgi:hypothetical protein